MGFQYFFNESLRITTINKYVSFNTFTANFSGVVFIVCQLVYSESFPIIVFMDGKAMIIQKRCINPNNVCKFYSKYIKIKSVCLCWVGGNIIMSIFIKVSHSFYRFFFSKSQTFFLINIIKTRKEIHLVELFR